MTVKRILDSTQSKIIERYTISLQHNRLRKKKRRKNGRCNFLASRFVVCCNNQKGKHKKKQKKREKKVMEMNILQPHDQI